MQWMRACVRVLVLIIKPADFSNKLKSVQGDRKCAESEQHKTQIQTKFAVQSVKYILIIAIRIGYRIARRKWLNLSAHAADDM